MFVFQFIVVKKLVSRQGLCHITNMPMLRYIRKILYLTLMPPFLEYLGDSTLDANDKFNRFLASLKDLVSKHAPLKKLTKKDIKFRDRLWINNIILKMMLIRNELT